MTATSQKIEYNVMADIEERLDDAGINNVITEHNDAPDAATYVRVICLNMRDILDGGTVPTGMRQADMAVECFSHRDDDTDGEDLHTLVESVRSAVYRDDILSLLNTLSTYNTYYGLLAGDDLPDEQDRFRIRSIQFSLILKPQKA